MAVAFVAVPRLDARPTRCRRPCHRTANHPPDAGTVERDPYLNLIYVRTQGTLSPGPAQWDNELHPNPNGFAAVAGKFRQGIQGRVPGREPAAGDVGRGGVM